MCGTHSCSSRHEGEVSGGVRGDRCGAQTDAQTQGLLSGALLEPFRCRPQSDPKDINVPQREVHRGWPLRKAD